VNELVEEFGRNETIDHLTTCRPINDDTLIPFQLSHNDEGNVSWVQNHTLKRCKSSLHSWSPDMRRMRQSDRRIIWRIFKLIFCALVIDLAAVIHILFWYVPICFRTVPAVLCSWSIEKVNNVAAQGLFHYMVHTLKSGWAKFLLEKSGTTAVCWTLGPIIQTHCPKNCLSEKFAHCLFYLFIYDWNTGCFDNIVETIKV